MNRKEYMKQLDRLLRDIPYTERQEALKYYEDYFEDAGAEHEADVIEELGSPEELAKKLREDLIIGHQAGNNVKKEKKVLNPFFITIIIAVSCLTCLAAGVALMAGGTHRAGRQHTDSSVSGSYKVYEGDGIRNLSMEVGVGELTIEYWDKDEISISYPDAYMEIEQDGEELSLETKEKWSLRSLFGNRAGKLYQVTVKIPRGYVFDEVEISTGAGKAGINGLETAILYLETGAGELTADGVIVTEKITIEAGVGETTIHNLQAKEADFSIGIGELHVDGRIDGNISADCGIGELTMELANQETDFDYDVSCGVGEVSINGKSYAGIGHTEEKNNGAPFDFNLNCGVGEIRVVLTDVQ